MPVQTLSKGERTSQEIIAAAHSLFSEQGYHGTSMRQIADRAGVTLGAIYNHFPGKEEIFKTLIIEYHPISEILPKLESIEGQDVPETVRFAAHTIQSTLNERADYINLLISEIIEFNGQHVNTIFEDVFPRAVGMANKLLSGKDLRSKNIPLMFLNFLALMFAYFLISRFLNQRLLGRFINLDLDQALDIFLYGVMDHQQGRAG
jgi:AcrR family transcriptional regulator